MAPDKDEQQELPPEFIPRPKFLSGAEVEAVAPKTASCGRSDCPANG